MIEMLSYDFMQRSLLAAAFIGVACSVTSSCYAGWPLSVPERHTPPLPE
jgi:hypothetical protein